MSRDSLLALLYAPTAKDALSGIVPTRFILTDTTGTALAATGVAANYPVVPPDVVRFIDAVSVFVIGGAAQIPTQVNAGYLRNGVIGARVGHTPNPALAAAATYNYAFLDLGWILLPGDQLQALGNFSAGAAANTVGMFAWGFDVPRANISGG